MRLRRTSSGYVSQSRGTEGPRHDPYSFTETVVVRNDVEHRYHAGGLGEWYKATLRSKIVGQYSTGVIRAPKNDQDRVYPCSDCGVLRSKDEGGTTFTVCDECWDKHYGKTKIGSGNGKVVADIRNDASRDAFEAAVGVSVCALEKALHRRPRMSRKEHHELDMIEAADAAMLRYAL